jgi:TATA-box binding protein (TBP) (component of TFIID and TFIIIB)
MSTNVVSEKKNNLPKFEDIPVSTKTFIVMTNLTLDIKKLSDFLPITDYIVVPKKRGRKKKTAAPDPNRNISDGSIITVDPGGGNPIRGVCLKKKKKNKEGKRDFFRNSTTVVMIMGGKKINFKVCRNGKFQMTGCKFDEHAENCVKAIWEYIKDEKDIYTMESGKHFSATFIPAMRNIDFSLGFLLDREKLDEFFNLETDYYSLLETSIGYTGVNIKIPVTIPITDLMLKQFVCKNGKWRKPKLVPYQTYLDVLKPKEQQKKIDKERFNTFLVFHSGKVIMSSMCADFARDTYYEFLDIIRTNQDLFEEKLDN